MSVEIPVHLLKKLGSEMKMDVHWVDVKLKDGRLLRGLVVKGGRYITGSKLDPDGEGTLPFTTQEIVDLRRLHYIPRPLGMVITLFGKIFQWLAQERVK